MNKTIAIASVAGFAGLAAAQSSAAYTMTASASQVNLGETVTFSVMGMATSGQVGNNSGINGVNLSVDIAGGAADLASVVSNDETFGATNVIADAEGFDISFSANSFAGNNFSSGLVLFSFDVTATQLGTLEITTGQGQVSTFNAATGLPGAFTQSVPYDIVDFASASVNVVPTPGAAAVLGLGGLAAARRRR